MVPYNYSSGDEESDYRAGTYERNASDVTKLLKTISIGVDDLAKGSVSETSYKFYNSKYSKSGDNPQEISCSNEIL